MCSNSKAMDLLNHLSTWFSYDIMTSTFSKIREFFFQLIKIELAYNINENDGYKIEWNEQSLSLWAKEKGTQNVDVIEK